MRRAAVMVLSGTLLLGSAQAAQQEGAPDPSFGKNPAPRVVQPVPGKSKAVRGKQTKPKAKVVVKKDDPVVQEAPSVVTETPAEATEQSIQLKGVRG